MQGDIIESCTTPFITNYETKCSIFCYTVEQHRAKLDSVQLQFSGNMTERRQHWLKHTQHDKIIISPPSTCFLAQITTKSEVRWISQPSKVKAGPGFNQQGHHEDENSSIRSLSPANSPAHPRNPTLTPREQLSVIR